MEPPKATLGEIADYLERISMQWVNLYPTQRRIVLTMAAQIRQELAEDPAPAG